MDIYGILELIILATDIPSIPKQTKLQPPITFLLESELYISFFMRNITKHVYAIALII